VLRKESQRPVAHVRARHSTALYTFAYLPGSYMHTETDALRDATWGSSIRTRTLSLPLISVRLVSNVS
jgi:hypothetical protein